MPYTRKQKTEFYEKSVEELKHLIGDGGKPRTKNNEGVTRNLSPHQVMVNDQDNLVRGKYALDDIGKMATVSTILKMNLPYFFFVGFYRVVSERMLQIGPYQGEIIACGTIPYERGVCGACAQDEKTIIVPDVTKFHGYIACDDETKSEIVVPVFKNGALLAVLDVDAVDLSAFNKIDQEYLEQIIAAHFP
jgi:GAF domain-containing protein